MQDQHYKGLIAEWYDDWLKEDTAHRDFFSGFFHGFQGQVLELACGTGRLLIPVAESGVTIHGLDSSQHMLDILWRKVADLNIEGIELYNQSMEEFSLPTQYDAIFVGFWVISVTHFTRECAALTGMHPRTPHRWWLFSHRYLHSVG